MPARTLSTAWKGRRIKVRRYGEREPYRGTVTSVDGTLTLELADGGVEDFRPERIVFITHLE